MKFRVSVAAILVACFFSTASAQIEQLQLLPQTQGGYTLPPAYSQPAMPAYTPPPVPTEIIQQQPVMADGTIIQGPIVTEGPPIVTEVAPPMGFWSGWGGGFELGLNGAEGNSIAQSMNFGFDLVRETARTHWSADLVYAKTSTNDVQTQHNGLFNTNMDFIFANPRWSWFNKLGLEYDEFKDFDIRLFLNTGLGYFFIQNDITRLKGRFGAGASREFGGVDEDWVPEAVFGADFEHQLTVRQKIGAVFDYYPSWEDFGDYRMITDAYWEYLLDQESNMNLRLSILDRYDSTPNGAERNDINYAVLLLWKM